LIENSKVSDIAKDCDFFHSILTNVSKPSDMFLRDRYSVTMACFMQLM
jgi:hypothetical protein